MLGTLIPEIFKAMASQTSGPSHAHELKSGDRYEFGANWARFLKTLDEKKIQEAEDSLKKMLGVSDLSGRTFLDIGSGSGLFSLAARRLGAVVTSFDYDPQSVACTQELKNRFFADDAQWRVETGSILDADYVRGLGKFDIVYSWGVLHHTGHMWRALENATLPTRQGSTFFIALYNYQPFATTYWTSIKRAYNKLKITRPLIFAVHAIYPMLPSVLLRLLRGQRYGRGMNPWHDLRDWLGGFPFEVAKPEEIFDFYKQRDFQLERLRTVGGRLGCNEFVFKRL
ncbi:class I SAM-dependent methyltransferase [Roseateles sp.]|uniref:class I SAM-dependent methyltransferase n=1 Tax=Roseateles sp. TaxID=1971397 RepID=UPI0039E780DB